jgi:superfamily I DNA and/or RNA helicase
MGYLLLNFERKSETGSTWDKDFYNIPLKKQYGALVSRYPQLRRFEYEQFIQSCFPVGTQKNYYFSMPNFKRDESSAYFNNIVIRSPRDNFSEYVLPKGLEIILIGDISMNPYGEFKVKGIEFIDESIYKRGEKEILANAVCAFVGKPAISNGNMVTVPNYGIRPDANESALTRDFMLEICTNCYTVSDPAKALVIYDKWKEYIDFRKYYLKEQGKERIQFDSCKAIECYIVAKRDYSADPEKYDKDILDELDDIRKDENQVIVTKELDKSEPFALIRVRVDKNKKELYAETVKNKGETPVFQQRLRRFTRSDILLENEDATKRVSVGERYRIFHKDIEPDYTKVEEQFKEELSSANSEIDRRFAAMLKQEVDDYVRGKTAELENTGKARLSEYETELSGRLARDISENKDEAVRKEYGKQVKEKEDTIRARMEEVGRQYEKKISDTKGNNTNGKEKNKDKKNDDVELIKRLEKEWNEKRTDFAKEIERQKTLVSLRGLYEERNKKLVAQKVSSLRTERDDALRRGREEKIREIRSKLEPQIQVEKQEKKRENFDELEKTKIEMKENETIRRYFIYFKLGADDTPEKINNNIESERFVPQYFSRDLKAEGTKIDRQRRSLNNFFDGYVKNPFLSTYLFAPSELGQTETELPEIEYFSPRLNDEQKEAVRKAVASESIFLLQGPPGTGKTEVIAEITAQLVKKGKRVLVSSETHKAIDNVFERLPKITEIRPLRLIPSQSKKEQSPYSPEKLVDNFYISISDCMNKEIEQFKNFHDDKEKFSDEYRSLCLENDKLKKESSRIETVKNNLNRIKRESDTLTMQFDAEDEKLRSIMEDKDELERRLKYIKSLNLSVDDDLIKQESSRLLEILKPYPMLKQDKDTLTFIYRANIAEIKEEISLFSVNPELIRLEAEHSKIKKQIVMLRDSDTDDIITGKEDDYKKLQTSLITISKDIKVAKSNSGVDLSELSVGKIIDKAGLEQNALASLVDIFSKVKDELIKWMAQMSERVGKDVDKKAWEYNEQKKVVDSLKGKIREKDREIQDKKEEGGYEGYRENESRLKLKISEFFDRFKIVKPYEGIEEALEIIKNEWNGLERSFAARESEYKEKIPVYRQIVKFLEKLPENDEIIETDRRAYTNKLFERANVFGMTCTSRDTFLADKMESFKKYALSDLKIKEKNIDAVIIDEVSKSSLLDLLIPILYGKTVILVGDHRQLPPMYDLRNMRKDDFEGLDPEIIDKEKNDEYTELFEECFFRTLFENVLTGLRVTLTKQYRCHEHIMKVFNHFYANAGWRGSLELGTPQQNDQKEHGLLIKNRRGKPLIETEKHIYFVDCGSSYEKFGDSTSATNELEARVIIELARKIDEEYGRGQKDSRMSMGVICTYGDQAKLIKNKLELKKKPLKNISEQHDERFIVSTVDDFQGDERDIIFVSMVRNPEPKNRARTKAEFVKKFERINVALSRARRLLVIAGAEAFLSSTAIDLPDMSGNKALDRKAYPVYREIINTIYTYGSVLKASDIIGEDK